MPKSVNAQLAQRLRERLGFDKSHVSDDGGVHVGCSQCDALVINGMATHEHGCPNTYGVTTTIGDSLTPY